MLLKWIFKERFDYKSDWEQSFYFREEEKQQTTHSNEYYEGEKKLFYSSLFTIYKPTSTYCAQFALFWLMEEKKDTNLYCCC